MCGIVAALVAPDDQAVGVIYEALLALQHRGQDAAGIITESKSGRLCLHKDNGMVRDVFLAPQLRNLRGPMGIGHVRYPTAGSSSSSEAQPFYVNSPYGITLAHNGNLVGVPKLKAELRMNFRHLNTGSDSEVLLNLLATELLRKMRAKGEGGEPNFNKIPLSPEAGEEDEEGLAELSEGGPRDEQLIAAVEATISRCSGGYAVVCMIAGFGLLAFRDPNGIRPLSFGGREPAEREIRCPVRFAEHELRASSTTSINGGGSRPDSPGSFHASAAASDAGGSPRYAKEYLVCSESGALTALGFELIGDVPPGHAMLLRRGHPPRLHDCVGAAVPRPLHSPCVFEYVYFARPDSVLDGVSVYRSRLKMGEKLAAQIKACWADHDIDVVIPVPDTARTAALECASALGLAYREGFMKNRYVGRTFIMPAQGLRRKSVRQKLSPIVSEFAQRNVLLVDDSIVRGTTSREIVQMAREAGAKRVYLASAAPPVRYPNVYGIDMPTKDELVASKHASSAVSGCDLGAVAEALGCDRVFYQELADLKASVFEAGDEMGVPRPPDLDCSCFDGVYCTGSDVNAAYFTTLANERRSDRGEDAASNSSHKLHMLDASPAERQVS